MSALVSAAWPSPTMIFSWWTHKQDYDLYDVLAELGYASKPRTRLDRSLCLPLQERVLARCHALAREGREYSASPGSSSGAAPMRWKTGKSGAFRRFSGSAGWRRYAGWASRSMRCTTPRRGCFRHEKSAMSLRPLADLVRGIRIRIHSRGRGTFRYWLPKYPPRNRNIQDRLYSIPSMGGCPIQQRVSSSQRLKIGDYRHNDFYLVVLASR